MTVGMRTRGLLIAIGLLGALMAIPLQNRTPQEELYRRRAVRHDELAAERRAAERRARAEGDLAAAERYRIEAERIEHQGWIYRKASDHRWQWQWPGWLVTRRS